VSTSSGVTGDSPGRSAPTLRALGTCPLLATCTTSVCANMLAQICVQKPNSTPLNVGENSQVVRRLQQIHSSPLKQRESVVVSHDMPAQCKHVTSGCPAWRRATLIAIWHCPRLIDPPNQTWKTQELSRSNIQGHFWRRGKRPSAGKRCPGFPASQLKQRQSRIRQARQVALSSESVCLHVTRCCVAGPLKSLNTTPRLVK